MVRNQKIAGSAAGKAANRAGVYVYGIVRVGALEGRGAIRSPAVGARDNRVRVVRLGDLAALVSDSPEARYDVSRENLLTHQRVLEEVLEFTEVIPAQFGLISSSDARICELLLKARHDDLLSILTQIRGRVELGLKVFWKPEKLFNEIAAGRDDICLLRDEVASRPEGSAHFEQIRLGKLVEQAMEELRMRDAEQIVKELAPLSMEMKTNRLLTEMMILNAAFLVEKKHEGLFDAAVDAIAERNAERLMMKYVGPLPPFNFVDLGWEAEN